MTELPPDTRITVNDTWAVGFCPSGLRRWFRAHPELDFREFLRDGTPVGDLPQDDAGVQRLIAYKLEQLNNG